MGGKGGGRPALKCEERGEKERPMLKREGKGGKRKARVEV